MASKEFPLYETVRRCLASLRPRSRSGNHLTKYDLVPLTTTMTDATFEFFATGNLAEENQAIKRRKSEEGCARQILNVKPPNRQHKSKPCLTGDSSSFTADKTKKEDKKTKPPPTTLTRPKEDVLERAHRVRLFKMKSAAELEEEMLAKMPKFKAIPLNKRILKAPTFPPIPRTAPHVTEFQEFHLATEARANKVAEKQVTKSRETDARIARPTAVAACRINKGGPKSTKADPFNLQTEERGAAKKVRFVKKLIEKEQEEKKTRIPKANPIPCTTDYPPILPKVELKPCTKPEPFQLKSLARHEEEMQKVLEENRKREKEEAEMRVFKAQPVIKEDPIPLPQKVRKPLTRMQSINLRVDHRADKREEFDQKIKKKDEMYKTYKEKIEAERLAKEEKAVKEMRRTMVHRPRPVPNFSHPFVPQKSCKEATKAKSSEKLVVHERPESRKLIRSAISSASQMR